MPYYWTWRQKTDEFGCMDKSQTIGDFYVAH